MRLGFALAGLMALSGCEGVNVGANAVRAVAIYDGGFVVQAPSGYCVDEAASRTQSGFVVLAQCALLARLATLPQADALITIQVGDAGSAIVEGSEEALVAYLQSASGRALLSDTGDGTGMTVGTVSKSEGLVTVRFSDTAAPMHEGLEADQWRGFLDINGRLVTVGLRGYSRAPITEAQGSWLLRRAIDSLRSGNPDTGS